MIQHTDYGRQMRKSPSLHSQKSTPTPKFLGTAKAYFVCHTTPNFQIFLIYAYIGCPQSVAYFLTSFRWLWRQLYIFGPPETPDNIKYNGTNAFLRSQKTFKHWRHINFHYRLMVSIRRTVVQNKDLKRSILNPIPTGSL